MKDPAKCAPVSALGHTYISTVVAEMDEAGLDLFSSHELGDRDGLLLTYTPYKSGTENVPNLTFMDVKVWWDFEDDMIANKELTPEEWRYWFKLAVLLIAYWN